MRLLFSRRFALTVWILTLLAISVAVAFKPGKLYRTFAAAGERFLNSEPLYVDRIDPNGPWAIPNLKLMMSEKLDLFRYTPLVAASFVPWSFLPEWAGGILWRCLQGIALLLALRAWARFAVPPVPWPALALLALPLSVGNLNNAQANALVAALMLAAVVCFVNERYWLSAASIAVATVFKVYPISLGLLLCVVEPRRYTARLLLLIAAGFLLPFVLQDPAYVKAQYEGLWLLLKLDDRSSQPSYEGYHDFQRLLSHWGLPISLFAYQVIEVAMGCLAAAIVWWGRRRGWARARQIHACLGLGLIWCTLFGPSTESATYMLVAPLIAYACIVVAGRPTWERVAIWGAYALFLSAYMAQWFKHEIADPFRATIMPQPHAALILLVWFLCLLFRPALEPEAPAKV
jgi:hypothetical protein